MRVAVPGLECVVLQDLLLVFELVLLVGQLDHELLELDDSL